MISKSRYKFSISFALLNEADRLLTCQKQRDLLKAMFDHSQPLPAICASIFQAIQSVESFSKNKCSTIVQESASEKHTVLYDEVVEAEDLTARISI